MVDADKEERRATANHQQQRATRLRVADEKNAKEFLNIVREAIGDLKYQTFLKQLRMHDQGILDHKQLEISFSRLLVDERDSDIAAAFKYFLPPEAADSTDSESNA